MLIPSLHRHYPTSSLLWISLTPNKRMLLVLSLWLLISQFVTWLFIVTTPVGSPKFRCLPCVRAMLSDPGGTAHFVVRSVVFTKQYWLDSLASQLSLGALSLKGDYLHPTAHTLPVYASRASLPDTRKTRYRHYLLMCNACHLVR